MRVADPFAPPHVCYPVECGQTVRTLLRDRSDKCDSSRPAFRGHSIKVISEPAYMDLSPPVISNVIAAIWADISYRFRVKLRFHSKIANFPHPGV